MRSRSDLFERHKVGSKGESEKLIQHMKTWGHKMWLGNNYNYERRFLMKWTKLSKLLSILWNSMEKNPIYSYFLKSCSHMLCERSTIAPYYMMRWNLTHSQIYLHHFESNYCWVQGMRSYSNHQTYCIMWICLINDMREVLVNGSGGFNDLKYGFWILWAKIVILWWVCHLALPTKFKKAFCSTLKLKKKIF